MHINTRGKQHNKASIRRENRETHHLGFGENQEETVARPREEEESMSKAIMVILLFMLFILLSIG
jgi:hypothetical protein